MTKPAPPAKSLQDDKYKMQLTDQITEELMKSILAEAIAQTPKFKVDKKEEK